MLGQLEWTVIDGAPNGVEALSESARAALQRKGSTICMNVLVMSQVSNPSQTYIRLGGGRDGGVGRRRWYCIVLVTSLVS